MNLSNQLSNLSFRQFDKMNITIAELFGVILKRRHTQGLLARKDYFELVDQVVGEYYQEGLLTDDDDTESIKTKLKMKWKEVEL